MTENKQQGSQPVLWITIGKIGAPHGVQGEIKLFPLSDVPERFERLQTVWWMNEKKEPRQLNIVSVRAAARFMLIKFKEFDSSEDVNCLTNGFLVIPQDQRGILPEGYYFVDDILGLLVEDEDGKAIGHVVDVLQTGSNDIYEVLGEKSVEVLIPARREYIQSIDFDKKRMIVRLPEVYE